jgi:hypothetical protein
VARLHRSALITGGLTRWAVEALFATDHRDGRSCLHLQALGELPGSREVRINTSQHTRAFFERFGFVVTEVEQEGFGPGLHRYAMSFRRSVGNGGG